MPPQNPSEEFGNLRKDSEAFRKVPHSSETFRNRPNDSATFRSLRNVSERNENHTLSVREVARMFENAGVARTERSIVNWCQPNKQGMTRLDSYFDTNENKYFITPQSVELAIAEEKAKAKKDSEAPTEVRKPQQSEERGESRFEDAEDEWAKVRSLKQEIIDLTIMNKGKDYFIEELRKERERFAEEREGFIQRMIGDSRKIGELETRLLQLGEGIRPAAPGDDSAPDDESTEALLGS